MNNSPTSGPLRSLYRFSGAWLVAQPANVSRVIFRVAVWAIAAFAISSLIENTGGLPSFYTHLYYPVVLVAALTLPLYAAIGVAIFAGLGLNTRGVLLFDTVGEADEALLRPIVLVLVATIANRLVDRIADSHAQLFQFLERMPVAISVLDRHGHHYYVNDLSEQITSRPLDPTVPADELDTVFGVFVEGTDDPYPPERMPIVRALAGETSVVDDMVLHRGDERVHLQVWGAPIVDRHGRVTHALAAFGNITEQRQAQQQIKHLAYHDPLTGLPNRRLMADRMAQALAQARRYDSDLVVLSLDLDGFKLVNDKWGHAAGDALLIETARRLTHAVRDSDTIARMDGDEFLVLLTRTSREEAGVVIGRIEAALAEPFDTGVRLVSAPASIGVAVLSAELHDADALMNAADRQMYAAKAHRQELAQAEGRRARSASS